MIVLRVLGDISAEADSYYCKGCIIQKQQNTPIIITDISHPPLIAISGGSSVLTVIPPFPD